MLFFFLFFLFAMATSRDTIKVAAAKFLSESDLVFIVGQEEW
jgi:hypothetical protein